MFNFTSGQRNALIFFSCLLGILLLIAGYLRLVRSGHAYHILLIQPTPMQMPSAEGSRPPPTAQELLPLPLVATPPARRPPRLRTPLNINAASTDELQALPGIGPALALRIASHREVHGPFHMAEDLLKVEGIGKKTLENIRPFIVCGPG